MSTAKSLHSDQPQRLIGMTFNMPADWHRRFKIQATSEGISMHELLLKCFSSYHASAADKLV